MAWFLLTDDISDVLSERPIHSGALSHMPIAGRLRRVPNPNPVPPIGNLGVATAGAQWKWASSVSPSPVSPSPVRPKTDTAVSRPNSSRRDVDAQPRKTSATLRLSETLLRLMAEAAHADGRDESVIWAEAAHEWLRRRAENDEPQPPSPASAHLPSIRARGWAEIDSLLTDLRHIPTTDSDAA